MTERIELRPGMDVAEWGYRTGRYPQSRIAFWRQQIEAERRADRRAGRVTATANGFTPTELVIIGLHPVAAPPGPGTPSLQQIVAGAANYTAEDAEDAEFAHLFPPGSRRAVAASGYEEDELDREVARLSGPPRTQASAVVDDDEWAVLFPPRRQ